MQQHVFTKEELLERIPQQSPFRFVDEILELSEQHIIGRYRFQPTEFYYAGHFPGNPITPGVILLEAMAQVGVVALGIYLLSKDLDAEEIEKHTTFFTDAQVEFSYPVRPGEIIITKAEKIFWRQKKIRAKVEAINEQGKIVASGTVSGMGVRR